VLAAAASGHGIGPAEVEAVAELARIALAHGEAERLARDLDRILAAAETLRALDLEGVDGAYRPSAEGPAQAWWAAAMAAAEAGQRPALGVEPGDGTARLRPDAPVAGLGREAALGAAPLRDEAFFVVPTVVDRA
jgi:Asp-tRNA(Asn)/Glu-tRNA(Gln) amidotransferase C subunit